jgi:hypothetical protein
MGMWLRLGAAVAITFALLFCVEQMRAGPHAGRLAAELQQGAALRLRGLFWATIFAVVMVMSVVAAARRQAAKQRWVKG